MSASKEYQYYITLFAVLNIKKWKNTKSVNRSILYLVKLNVHDIIKPTWEPGPIPWDNFGSREGNSGYKASVNWSESMMQWLMPYGYLNAYKMKKERGCKIVNILTKLKLPRTCLFDNSGNFGLCWWILKYQVKKVPSPIYSMIKSPWFKHSPASTPQPQNSVWERFKHAILDSTLERC